MLTNSRLGPLFWFLVAIAFLATSFVVQAHAAVGPKLTATYDISSLPASSVMIAEPVAAPRSTFSFGGRQVEPPGSDSGGWSGAGIYSVTSGDFGAVIMHPITKVTNLFHHKNLDLWIDGYGGTTVGKDMRAIVGTLADFRFSIADNVDVGLGVGTEWSAHKPGFVVGGFVNVRFVTH